MKQIAAAFIKAKREFAPALKNSVNPHFKSKYADLSNCIEAVDGALLNNGIVMYQETSEVETGVTVETVLLHESGEFIRCGKLHVPASKQDAQGYGSALTYARRYSLMAACGIAQEDDDGNAATAAPGRPQGTITPTTGLWEALDEDTRTNLETCAMDVKVLLSKGDVLGAVEYIGALKLDTDTKSAFWTRFDSKQRSAMKSAAQQLREAA